MSMFFMSKDLKIILIIVIVVALFSLFVLFKQSGITGFSAKRLNVQYIDCHYLDNDNQGSCIRIERQFNSRKCNPAGIDLFSSKKIHDMNLFICKPGKTPKFFA